MRVIAIILAFFIFSYVEAASKVKVSESSYIPPHAFTYKDIIKAEIDNNFSNLYDYNYIPALIEHESCQHLKHKRCWRPDSELRTSRERGVGLGQITKTFNEDGSVRFDILREMRDKYKDDLKELAWDTIATRVDLQVRTIVLMVRDTYKKLYMLENPVVRLQMTDSAYNGGLKHIHDDRRLCSLKPNCNPNVWFNNVEKYSVKSNKPNKNYSRTFYQINRDHVVDVFMNNLPKYNKQYFIEKGYVNGTN